MYLDVPNLKFNVKLLNSEAKHNCFKLYKNLVNVTEIFV